jgi:hypothetical protein
LDVDCLCTDWQLAGAFPAALVRFACYRSPQRVLIGTLEKQQAFVFGWKQGCFGGEFSV